MCRSWFRAVAPTAASSKRRSGRRPSPITRSCSSTPTPASRAWARSTACSSAAARCLRHDLEKALVPAVIGEDPFRISWLVKKMDDALDGVEEAKAAIEMALWDIVGKALNTPVYNLLGGKVRDRIPLSYSIPFGAPDDMATLAQERVKWGHRTIKVKVGSDDSARDIAGVKAIRKAIGPDVKLRVDGNMGWQTAKQAIAVILAMEECNLELVEQPLPAHDLDGMAEVRRSIGVPLMADESIRNPRSAMEVIRKRRRRYRERLCHRGRRTAERREDLCDVRSRRHALHDRQHAGIRHRHRGADPSRRRHEQSGSRQRHVRRALPSGRSADEAAADRERILVSAGGSGSRRRGRHESVGSLEQGGASRRNRTESSDARHLSRRVAISSSRTAAC